MMSVREDHALSVVGLVAPNVGSLEEGTASKSSPSDPTSGALVPTRLGVGNDHAGEAAVEPARAVEGEPRPATALAERKPDTVAVDGREPEAGAVNGPESVTVAVDGPESVDEGGGSERLPVSVEAGEALPELARAAAGIWLKAAAWGLGTSLRVGARLARAASEPETAATELYLEVRSGLRDYAREFLGIADLDERVRDLTPLTGSSLRRGGRARSEVDLRAQGAELLRRAAEVGFDETAHPAYSHILTELAPDEARILRLLAEQGPQPMVDIRAGNLIGLGSQLIAQSLNMLGARAGLRRRERVPAYLNNLVRLGLVVLSDEPLGGPATYQVLEAQPEVLGTLKSTARARAVHRSVQLSPFGADFCAVCLPLEPPARPELTPRVSG